MIGFGVPIILSVLLWAFNRIGFKGPWCWIRIEEKGDKAGLLLQMGFYLIFFGSGFLNIILGSSLLVYISKDKEVNEIQKQRNKNLVCKMYRHPIILVIMILPTIIIRLITRENIHSEGTKIVNSIGIIGISSFGVVSVFSYGFTCDFINMIKEIATYKTFMNLSETSESMSLDGDDMSNLKELKLHLKD